MCDRPISAVDAEYAEALAAGWSESDISWEKKQEHAAALTAEANSAAAAVVWKECLQLARENFSGDDLRLGTSLANAAISGQSGDAAAMLLAARKIWTASAAWIDHVNLPQQARSSLHHFRMEVKHRRVYRTTMLRKLHDTAAAVRLSVDRLDITHSTNADDAKKQLARWQIEKPPVFGDSRKVLSACFLLMAGD